MFGVANCCNSKVSFSSMFLYDLLKVNLGLTSTLHSLFSQSWSMLLIVSPPMSCLIIHFCKAYPSWTGDAIVRVFPQSKTKAELLPHANEDKTLSLHKKRAGTLYFSNKNSVSFSLKSLQWIELSVKISGVSFGESIKLPTIDFSSSSSSTSKLTKHVVQKITYFTCPLPDREEEPTCNHALSWGHLIRWSTSFSEHLPFLYLPLCWHFYQCSGQGLMHQHTKESHSLGSPHHCNLHKLRTKLLPALVS